MRPHQRFLPVDPAGQEINRWLARRLKWLVVGACFALLLLAAILRIREIPNAARWILRGAPVEIIRPTTEAD